MILPILQCQIFFILLVHTAILQCWSFPHTISAQYQSVTVCWGGVCPYLNLVWIKNSKLYRLWSPCVVRTALYWPNASVRVTWFHNLFLKQHLHPLVLMYFRSTLQPDKYSLYLPFTSPATCTTDKLKQGFPVLIPPLADCVGLKFILFDSDLWNSTISQLNTDVLCLIWRDHGSAMRWYLFFLTQYDTSRPQALL